MIELQRAIFLKMAGDAELLNLLGLVDTDESEISKRLTPTPPLEMSQDNQPLIYFRFPQTYISFGSKLMEFRPIQFRVWGSDSSLVIQQKIGKRLLALFVGQRLRIENCRQYSKPYYVGQTMIGGVVNDLYGYAVEIKIATYVEYFNEGG